MALRRTREESSCAVLAPDSSSFGSTPMRRSTRFAVPFSRATAGRKTVVKPDWKGITHFATRIGSASARFFGSSSPRIMLITVAMSRPRITPIGVTTCSGTPSACRGASMNADSAGSNV